MKHCIAIGVVVVVALGMASIGSAAETPPTAQPPHTPATPSASDGRFVIYFSPHARADVYLVDTKTGRIWKPVTYTDVAGNPEVWMPQTRIDSNEELRAWLEMQKLKPGTGKGR